MKRWIGVAFVTMGLALGACSKKQTTQEETPGDESTAFAAAPDNEAILGGWSDGQNTFTFNKGGTYSWVESIRCSSPPCKEVAKANGTYQFRGQRILLGGGLGAQGDLSLNFSWANQQNTLQLTGGAGTYNWTLNRR